MPPILATGKYYSGQVGKPHKVTIAFTGGALRLKADGGSFEKDWSLGEVQVLERAVAPQPAKLTSKNHPESRLYIDAGPDWRKVRKLLPRNAFPRFHLPVSWKSFIGYTGFSIAIIILLFFSAPQLLSYGAYLIPQSTEGRLGRYILDSVIEDPMCIAPEGLEALNKLTATLQAGTQRDITYNVRVISDHEMLNAMASPGGHLAIFSGVLHKTESPDEVAGVLAHEMAHIEKRHAMQALVRDLGLSVLLQMTFGDQGIVELAGTLNELHYSREDETEADYVGQKLLEKANIDPQNMTSFFERIKEEEGERWDSKFLQYLSTHPLTEERIRKLEKYTPDNIQIYQPVLNEQEWRDLKKICTEKQAFR